MLARTFKLESSLCLPKQTGMKVHALRDAQEDAFKGFADPSTTRVALGKWQFSSFWLAMAFFRLELEVFCSFGLFSTTLVSKVKTRNFFKSCTGFCFERLQQKNKFSCVRCCCCCLWGLCCCISRIYSGWSGTLSRASDSFSNTIFSASNHRRKSQNKLVLS